MDLGKTLRMGLAILLTFFLLFSTSNAYSTQIPPQESSSILSFWFASPPNSGGSVDVKVTNPLGQITTKDINQIPDAFYEATSNLLGPKFITILNPIVGVYGVEIMGIGIGGEYHIGVSYVDDDSDHLVTKDGVIGVGEQVKYTVRYDPEITENPISVGGDVDINNINSTILKTSQVDEIKQDIQSQNLLSQNPSLSSTNTLASEKVAQIEGGPFWQTPFFASVIYWITLLVLLVLIFSPFIVISLKRFRPIGWYYIAIVYIISVSFSFWVNPFVIYFLAKEYRNLSGFGYIVHALEISYVDSLLSLFLLWPLSVFYVVFLLKRKFTPMLFLVSLTISVLFLIGLYFFGVNQIERGVGGLLKYF